MSERASVRFIDLLGPLSHIKYAAWRLLGGHTAITVSMRNGCRIRMRNLRTTDYAVAREVFLGDVYRMPPHLSIDPKTIVDLGADVGYSVVYWLTIAPTARVIAFEPHPQHVEALLHNVELNAMHGRVDVRACAAGTKAGVAGLSNRGSSSSLAQGPASIRVPVTDLFTAIAEPIDILKVDIEGAEYELLEDPRLRDLSPRAIVVEWHGRGGFERIEDILNRQGYEVVRASEGPHETGILWGYLG
jgi:FkbM family methyltransferase